MTSPNADTATIIGVVKPPAATRESLEVMTGEKPRPSSAVAGAVRLTSAATEVVKALEARFKAMSNGELLEAAQATKQAAREAGEKRGRNEHQHAYSLIARVARQRGVDLQPLRPPQAPDRRRICEVTGNS